MIPRWTMASTSPVRKRSFNFFRRRSSCSCWMSFGRPAKGRRSTPMTRRSRCNARARCFPRRPQMPVTRTAPAIGSPEDVTALLEGAAYHFLYRLPDEPHFFFHDGVVVVGVAGKAHRFAEPESVLGRQGK